MKERKLSFYKVNPNGSKTLRAINKSMKVIEENTEEKLHNIALAKISWK